MLERHAILPATTIALILLAGFLGVLVASSWNDSAIFDETAHIAAGYSYVTQLDYRLNPEHPPLIKDLAALPLLFFSGLRFPTEIASWTDDINGQWDQGRIFLYESGNNPDQILFWMRFPIMLLSVLLGWLMFRWTKNRFGSATALLALALYCLSPTIIAHSRFVTTDIGAAVAFFIGLATFIRVLEHPSKKNIIWAGIAFGLAQTMKYSLFLLVPTYLGIALVWAYAATGKSVAERLALFARLLAVIIAIGVIGLGVIWLVFAPHLINYPVGKNISDARAIIGNFRIRPLATLDFFLLGVPLLRPIGQYLFGLMMITQRAVGGNTQYFLGEITSQGSRLYFPLLYLLKESLAYHLLSLIALSAALRRIASSGSHVWLGRLRQWIHEHPAEFSMIFFVLFYWAYSVLQPLNIGLRHVLPTFPFLFILVAKGITSWIRGNIASSPQNLWEALQNLFRMHIRRLPRVALTLVLLVWLLMSSINTFPHYLSYFNSFGGGIANGYGIATDSNYDWGQDLIRLKNYVENPPDGQPIAKIALDYFGGGNPSYYLGEKFEPWWSARGRPAAGGYLAISANALMGAYGAIGPGFIRKAEDSYEWLKPFRPIGRAGTSIFIYQLPPEE